jgi:predicted 3-demethylubiquinone-9 3-methyltransferase (glyoxalase superfamily)
MKHPLYPCFWYDGQSKAAADLYCSLFKHSKIVVDTPMAVNFELEGKFFMGLNGGPMFKINPSISQFVICTSDEEIDTLCEKLLDVGSALMPLGSYPWSSKYAWVKDKFGLSWQLMKAELTQGSQRIFSAFLFANEQYGNAKKAIDFYTSVFPNSKANDLQFYEGGEAQMEGKLKFGSFTLNGQDFSAMDGPGDHAFKFNEAVSFVVNCDTQEEIDFYWNKLTEAGEESRCGWLKDQFGVSWQIVPTILGKLMSDPEKRHSVMEVVMKSTKFEIQQLLNA